MPQKRTKALHMLATPDEYAMLHAIAEHEGLTASDVVRQYIRRRHAELFGNVKPKRKTSARNPAR